MKSALAIADGIEDGKLSDRGVRRAVEIFDANGCLVIDEIFDRGFVRGLQKSFFAEYGSTTPADLHGKSIRTGHNRYIISVDLKGAFNTPFLYANPILLQLLHGILGEDCVLNTFGVVVAFPGAEQQHVHRDS